MANKQNFTPDEWTKVLESMMLAGVAVSAAEPSGLWGTLKEGFASSSTIAKSKLDARYPTNSSRRLLLIEARKRPLLSVMQAAQYN